MILHTHHLFHITRTFLLLLCMSVAGVVIATAQSTITSRQPLRIDYQSGTFAQDSTPPVAAFIYVFRSDGTTYEHDALTGTNPIADYTITPNIEPLLSGGCTDRKVKKAELLLRLDLGETYEWKRDASADGFTVEFKFEVRAYNGSVPLGSFTITNPITLSLNKSEPEKLVSIDYTNLHEYSQVPKLTSGYVTSFKITKISYTYPPGKDAILKKVRFWVGDRLEIVSKATDSQQPGVSLIPSIQKVAEITGANPVTFHWSPECKFPNYQFQLLRLYNIENTAANRADEKKIAAAIDWSKALTIETESSDPHITLTIAEGTGYYIWRVRPIGDFYEGGIANDDNWGVWSDWTDGTTSSGSLISLTNPSTAPDAVFFYQQFDSDKNWIYQRSFSEDHHINEQMVYANGLSQVRQNQVRLPSKGAVLANQTVYDFAGRPSITSMTAPLLQSNGTLKNALGFQQQLLRIDGPLQPDESPLYRAKFFDTDEHIINGAKPITKGNVAIYYSNDNPDQTIPLANGYPYTRTTYYTDGTSRPKEISGVGLTHSIRPQEDTERHTTRYAYATPSDDELIAVFGHEAPAASSVQKVMTWDANNIASVQYISKDGKTIATCLVNTTSNSNLAALPRKSDPVTNPTDELEIANEDKEAVFDRMVRDTIRAGTTTGQFSHSSGKNISIGSNQVLTFHYKLFPEVLQFECGSTEWCAVGDYEVDLRLRNVEDPTKTFTITLPVNKSHHMDIEGGAVACNTITQPPQPVSYVVNTSSLSPGTYTVERNIRTNTLHNVNNVNETHLETYLNRIRQDLKAEFDAALVPIYTALNVSDPDPVVEQQALKAALENLYTQYPSGIIDAGCCHLSLPPQVDCEKELCNEMKRTSEGQLDLEGMLIARWQGKPKRWIENPVNSNPAHHYSTDITEYFYTNKTGVASNHTIQNSGDFNILVQNMINDGYTCEQLSGCWIAFVEGFESMASAGGGGEPIDVEEKPDFSSLKDLPVVQNQDFDLLESFLRCVGTMYGKDGVSPLVTNSADYDKIVLNAHKYFYQPSSSQVNDCIALLGPLPSNPADWSKQSNGEYKWDEFYFCITARNTHHVAEVDEQEIRDHCTTQCDDRFEGFINEVRHAYHTAGKVIDNDPQAATQKPDVTMNEILCIAGRLVTKCKEDCASSNYEDVVKALGYDVAIHVPTIPDETCGVDFIKLDAPVSYSDNTLQEFVNKLNEALAHYKDNPAFDNPVYEEDWYVSYLEIASTENMGLNCCGNPNMKVRGEWTQSFVLDPPNGGSDLRLVTTLGAAVISEEFICDLGRPCAPICFAWVEPEDKEDNNSHIDPIVFRQRTCEHEFAEYILTVLDQQREECVGGHVESFVQQYYDKLSPEAIKEEFYVEYNINQYHYTLYYYDRAGNLVQTVPPRGVDILMNGTSTAMPDRKYDEPAHTYKTTYVQNSLAQAVEQQTPDGSITRLVYDSKGRVRFSQSARQRGKSLSYTKYDNLGRVIEVGETTQISLIGNTPNSTDFNPVLARENADLWNHSSAQYEPSTGMRYVTQTVYTTPQTITYNSAVKEQRYLQNRVSMTVTDEDGNFSSGSSDDRVTTYYSYDPHGNVEWVVQELPLLGKKFIRYEYDLISNKPLAIHYNEGMIDQFHHRFTYDDENRLTLAETSRDGKVWDRDAAYQDHLHGSLRRTEIGEDGVQGTDYVYTISGWLKGINHPNFGTSAAQTRQYDPGLDGEQTVSSGTAVHKDIARDAFGMILGYYEGDFARTGSPFNSNDPLSIDGNPFHLQKDNIDLYNGNIASWTSGMEYVVGNDRYTTWTGETYRYDHLNRLLTSQHHERSGSAWMEANSFNTGYRYDPNGNIMRLRREMPSARMDDLTYHYQTANNRLSHVTDVVGNSATDVDIDNQNPGNYDYDEDGNLIKDKDGNKDIDIEWTAYGKVHKVIKHEPGGSSAIEQTIVYLYNAQGNRVVKDVYDGDMSAGRERTWYVHAADGNVLAVYKKANGSSLPVGGTDMGSTELPGEAPMVMVGPGELSNQESSTRRQTVSESLLQQSDKTLLRSNNSIVAADVPPASANPTPGDMDGDGIPDSSDPDIDGDSKLNEFDNCPYVANFNQSNIDGDAYGDVCDPDIDGDGVLNENDLCPNDAPLPQNDINKDGCTDQQSGGGGSGTIQLAELYIYGRSRVGVMKPVGVYLSENGNTTNHNVDVAGTEHDSVYVRRVMRKNYELTDHLGNVRVVISDVKETEEVDGDNKPEGPYETVILAANNYYPFGMLQPGRHWETGEYRYGYNGKEMDNEVSGEGNQYDYGFRIYNPRIAKFLSVDPLAKSYPMLTPYQFASNTPIWAVDLDGLEAFFTAGTGQSPTDTKHPNMRKSVAALYEFVYPEKIGEEIDYGFSWYSPLINSSGTSRMLNNEEDRERASRRLIDYVLANHNKGEDITLIGYSHGCNVSVQSVLGLRKALDARGEIHTKINLLFLSPPSYNDKGDEENPLTVKAAFDRLDYFYTIPKDRKTFLSGITGIFDKTIASSTLYSGAALYYYDTDKTKWWNIWDIPTPLENSKMKPHPVTIGTDYPDWTGNTHGWIFFFDQIVKPYIKKQQQSNGGS